MLVVTTHAADVAGAFSVRVVGGAAIIFTAISRIGEYRQNDAEVRMFSLITIVPLDQLRLDGTHLVFPRCVHLDDVMQKPSSIVCSLFVSSLAFRHFTNSTIELFIGTDTRYHR